MVHDTWFAALCLCSQVTGIVLVLIAQEMQQELRTSESQCGVEQVSNSSSLDYVCRLSSSTTSTPQSQDQPMDFTYPLIFYLIVGVLALMVMVIFFRPEYKRLKAEKRAKTMNRLQETPTKDPGSDDGGSNNDGGGDGGDGSADVNNDGGGGGNNDGGADVNNGGGGGGNNDDSESET